MSRSGRYWIGVLVILIIGVALRGESLRVGFGMDDYAQLAMLDDAYPVERGPWDLFSFSKGDPDEVHTLMSKGSLAWWSHPELKLCALRPGSSLLMWLDVKLFGHAAVWHHVHTLVWWSVMLLAAALLLRRVLPQRWAVLALLLYALDECHTYPIGWLANRNAIVSATFAFLALYAHVRHREDDWRPGRWLSPLSLALAFSGGEYTLCILPFYVLYELCSAPGSAGRRAKALAPMLAMFVGYVLLHRGLGYGSFASAVYVDPAREPLAWLQMAAFRLPVLVADMFLAIPTSKMAISRELIALQAKLGPAALLMVCAFAPGAWRRLPPPERKRLLWLLLASLASILPVASSFVSARLLLIPTLAGHAVLAALILDGWDRVRSAPSRYRPMSLLRGLLAAALLAAHIPLATGSGLDEMRNIYHVNEGTRQAALLMPVDDERLPQQRHVVLVAADPMTLLYPAMVRWVEGHPMPRSRWVLSMAPRPHMLTRISADAFEMEVIGGTMLTGQVEMLFRRNEFGFSVGEQVKLDGLTITILKVDPEGRPFKARYQFDRSLEDPDLVLLLATRRGMLRYPMGPVGAPLPIPPAKLPMVLDGEVQPE